jgi:hypothetical protein
MATPQQWTGLVAHLDRAWADYLAYLRERLGFEIHEQRDPGGRIVSYGYHWHRPDAHGACPYLIVYGYETDREAVQAGLTDGLMVGLAVIAREDEPVHPHFVKRCERVTDDG